MNKARPCWDEVWMRVATTIAERSVDPKHKVGAIIVTEDNTQLLSLGYNGNYKGGPNSVESSEPGETGLIHAEINALLKMDYNIPKKKKMYVLLIKFAVYGNASHGGSKLIRVRPMTIDLMKRNISVFWSVIGHAGATLGAESVTTNPARSSAAVTSAG